LQLNNGLVLNFFSQYFHVLLHHMLLHAIHEVLYTPNMLVYLFSITFYSLKKS
jgi:hypothetical protein